MVNTHSRRPFIVLPHAYDTHTHDRKRSTPRTQRARGNSKDNEPTSESLEVLSRVRCEKRNRGSRAIQTDGVIAMRRAAERERRIGIGAGIVDTAAVSLCSRQRD